MRRLAAVLLLCSAALGGALGGCNSFLDGGTKLGTDAAPGDARSYMNDALDIMQRYSINKYKIDWTPFRAAALARLGGVTTTDGLYAAVTATVKALGDAHSGFFPPTNIPGTSNPAPSTTNVPSGKLLDARIAYLFVPAFS